MLGVFGANAYENGGRKKSRKMSRKRLCKENYEKGPRTRFPLKEQNLRLPSSEFCRFAIGSYTLSVLEARWRIIILLYYYIIILLYYYIIIL